MTVRQSVVVDGVTLSREQVEKAIKELNEEVLRQPENLMRVRCLDNPYGRGVVLVGDAQDRYRRTFSGLDGRYTVINESGGGCTYRTAAGVWGSWELIDDEDSQ